MQQPPQGPQRTAQSAAQQRASAEVAALDVRRSELKSQLQSLTDRRAMLSAQLESTQGAGRRDLEARIKTLDDRTARIDDELNSIDDRINAAIAQGATREPSGFDKLITGAFSRPPEPAPGLLAGGRENDIATVLAVQGIGFVLLGLVLWRGLRRRASAAIARLAPEDASRLAQLQSAVDVMAVEIERIAEGQRYVAKVLSDKNALSAGAAEALRVERRDPEPVKASSDRSR